MNTIPRLMCCRRSRLIALIVMVLAAYGCASGPTLLSRPTLIGDWKAVDGTATVRFSADGVFHAVDNQGMPVSGNYRLVGSDGIQFEIRHGGEETETIDARIIQAGERLTLIFPGENAMETYKRIP
ncbi:hypothetical protein [Desulfosarcina sp.]|uniref:hypothetical protein n=1 Tax=Desulfosarcina sp. TaxID=2027861 RepID=UPI003567019E